MEQNLPTEFDPELLARRDALVEGRALISQFARVVAALASEQGEIWASLRFFAHGRLVGVKGQVSGWGMLRCERCVQPYRWEFEFAVNSGFVFTEEQAERLADGVEPVFKDDRGRVQLVGLLEDELLLAMPLIGRHPGGECMAEIAPYLGEEEAAPNNALANALAALKNGNPPRQH